MESGWLSHWSKRSWMLGLISAVCVALALGVFLYAVFNSDQGPMEPTPDPTVQPTMGPATPATPLATISEFDPNPLPPRGSLLAMLAYAPDRLADNSLPLSDIAQYANIQAWMEQRGLHPPDETNGITTSAWQKELSYLALPDVLQSRASDPIWKQTYGFGLPQVHQVLAVGSAPDYVLVFQGDFNVRELHAAWVESGYQAVRVDNMTIWSLHPGDSVDLSAPASRPALGNLNNIVVLDDGTIIATSRMGRMKQTVRAINGQTPSLADNSQLLSLFGAGTNPEQLVSATLQRGIVLETPTYGTPTAVAASPTLVPPRAQLVLLGIQVVPSRAEPVFVIVCSYGSVDDATMAQARAYDEIRTGVSDVTGEAFSARVKLSGMRVIATGSDTTLLLIEVQPVQGFDDWRAMVESRDFGFIMWPRDEP